ncbi:MAG: hypothetical protein WBP59_12255 [Ilumatobacteraceae bacterium]
MTGRPHDPQGDSLATFQPSIDQFGAPLAPMHGDAASVANTLGGLDAGWTVYVRPHIGQDVPDFLVVHDRFGVCTITAIDPSAPSGAQVAAARRHRMTIYDQCLAFPGDARTPSPAVRSAVVVAGSSTTAAAASVDRGPFDPDRSVSIVGGTDLVEWLTTPAAGPPPTPAALARLRRDIVVPGVVAPATPPVVLSANARVIVDNPRGVRVRGATGPAGTGKSFALTARAARLAAEGKDVLVLSFNLTLSNRLRTLVVERCAEFGADPSRVTCTSFHTFCARAVEDAAMSGIVAGEPTRGTWPVKIVAKTAEVFERGFDRHFDAVLVDEGQDFRLEWWNLLREHVVRDGGEMFMATDPMVDLGGKQTWDDEATRRAAGFVEPWIQTRDSYRMGPALIESTNEFARVSLDEGGIVPSIPDDQTTVVGHMATGVRSWRNVARVADLGVEMGREVVRLLSEHPTLSPRDVVYLCEYHHDGLAAAQVIEAAGHPVHHVYSRDPDDRHQRKARFWPGADAVKGCTVHSFKGWESPAVVVGIGVEERSRRLAYASMTRVSATHGLDQSYLVVVNTDPRIASFRSTFEPGAPLDEPVDASIDMFA